MIRFTWRQFRVPAVAAAGALLVLAAFALVTGPDLARSWSATLTACGRAGDCPSATAAFARTDGVLAAALGTLVSLVPALVGAFWGAPAVARELEGGTLPLVWTQSVTRGRWMLVRLGVVGAATALATALLSLAVTWWAAPLDRAGATRYATFAQRDVVPVGHALFAFALGVTAGLLVRRTVPAMAVTLVAFTAVRVVTAFGLRPRLVAPEQHALALDPGSTGLGSAASPSLLLNGWFNGGPSSALDPATPPMPDAWILSTRVVDGGGHALTDAVLDATCPAVMARDGAPPAVPGHVPVAQDAREAFQACVSRIGATYHEVVTFQPSGRYWTLQWLEAGLFTGAALLLAAFCVWWIRRV